MQAKDCWISLMQMPVPQDVTSVGSHTCPGFSPPLHVHLPNAGSWALAVPK